MFIILYSNQFKFISLSLPDSDVILFNEENLRNFIDKSNGSFYTLDILTSGNSDLNYIDRKKFNYGRSVSYMVRYVDFYREDYYIINLKHTNEEISQFLKISNSHDILSRARQQLRELIINNILCL